MEIDMRSIEETRQSLVSSDDASSQILHLASRAIACTNRNLSKNSYLWLDEDWTEAEAVKAAGLVNGLAANGTGDGLPLAGIPVSVKDCFDITGAPTTCGTKYYRHLHGEMAQDSWLVDRLRAAGAVIVGKTHLHPLAYGITGENADFGDCLQPNDSTALTGGSSSGAAASLQEGSAMAAIGTDTGGSIRVPAALCGLAGYRATLGRGDWRGGAHLAESFDTMGWLFHDLEDGPLLGSIFGSTASTPEELPGTFAVIDDGFFDDCDATVIASMRECRRELEALGLMSTIVTVDWWSESIEIFTTIQAFEAARIHHGHYAAFEPGIRERLEWGASLSLQAIEELRRRHAAFRDRMDSLLAEHSLLMMPAAPVVRLDAGADHSQTRMRLLRYTSPVSLAGMPAVTLPFINGGFPAGGMQLIAARESDAQLLAIAAKVGSNRKTMSTETQA